MLILSGLVLRVTLEAVLNGESVTRNTKLVLDNVLEGMAARVH